MLTPLDITGGYFAPIRVKNTFPLIAENPMPPNLCPWISEKHMVTYGSSLLLLPNYSLRDCLIFPWICPCPVPLQPWHVTQRLSFISIYTQKLLSKDTKVCVENLTGVSGRGICITDTLMNLHIKCWIFLILKMPWPFLKSGLSLKGWWIIIPKPQGCCEG